MLERLRVWVNTESLKGLPDEFTILVPIRTNARYVSDGVFRIPNDLVFLNTFYMVGKDVDIQLPLLRGILGYVVDGRQVDDSPEAVADMIMRYATGTIRVSKMLVYGIEELPLWAEYTRSVWFGINNVRKFSKKLGEDVVREKVRYIIENMMREFDELINEIDFYVIFLISDTGKEVVMHGYIPYVARKRVSKSGKYVNITGKVMGQLGGARPDYVLVELPIEGARDVEVNINGNAQYLGVEDGHVYVLARAGVNFTVELWQGNYLRAYEVSTGPPVSIKEAK